MLKVGVTGGIGSGKTTVCRIFESIGVPVYYSDTRAKALMYRSKPLKAAIKDLLGAGAYHSNGRPNRRYIASKIFTDKVLLKGINELVHPAVRADHLRWHQEQSAAYTINEAALLVENGSYKQLDQLIVVTASEKVRIERVLQRDQSSIELIKKRMKNQMSEAQKIKVADFLIDNEGSKSLIKQVWKIHKALVLAANNQK